MGESKDESSDSNDSRRRSVFSEAMSDLEVGKKGDNGDLMGVVERRALASIDDASVLSRMLQSYDNAEVEGGMNLFENADGTPSSFLRSMSASIAASDEEDDRRPI